MTKAIRVAVLSAVFALSAAPLFAGPGGGDPTPPPASSPGVVILTTVLSTLGF